MKQIGELIPEAMQSRELVISEQKKSETGPLQTALNDTRICQLSDREPLHQSLRYAFMLVGLRGQNLPNQMETELLIQFIVKKFGGHTAKEIKLAFEMAVAGELDCDATCYENFSVLYFSNIMNAYREWAAQEFKQSIKHVDPPEKKIDKLIIDLEYCCYKQNMINKLPCKLPYRR